MKETNQLVKGKTMFRIPAYSLLLKSIALTLVVAGLTAAYARPIAATKHPASVPDGFVITPIPAASINWQKGMFSILMKNPSSTRMELSTKSEPAPMPITVPMEKR